MWNSPPSPPDSPLETVPSNPRSPGIETPFAQQFNYHLQDLAIVRQDLPRKPEGEVSIHLPDIRAVKVEFNRRETIECFRARVQEMLPDIRVRNYYFVSSYGIICDGQTLDEYFITPGANILLIRKGIHTRDKLANRRFWLKSYECARKGEPRPPSVLSAPKGWKARRITPYRTSKEAVKFAREHQ
jgi:hypothetical protein